ncbi:AAA domain-containing protein [Phyllobacterium sp. OV277]|nr:AAA domain-containing protein [Phyllobacterium sp. OV277]
MIDLSGHILILTGPPGSGKSTTAASLVANSEVPAVHLHSDDFWHYIKNGLIQPYLPEAHAQNKTVIDVLAGAAERYAKGNFFVVVDGIIGPWFLDPFRSLSLPLHYIILRPILSEAIARCQRRGGNTLSDQGPISELHRQFSALDGLKRHVIETAGQSREETLEAVQTVLADGTHRLNPVD